MRRHKRPRRTVEEMQNTYNNQESTVSNQAAHQIVHGDLKINQTYSPDRELRPSSLLHNVVWTLSRLQR